MNTYIPVEKLIAEIKRYKNKADERLKIKGRSYAEELKDSALQNLCGNLLYFIDSLQQEQPKFKVGDTIHKKGENTVFPMVIEGISDVDYVCDGGKCFVSIKFQDDYELVQQEHPEVDLEKEIDREWKKCMPIDEGMGAEYANIAVEQFDFIARHFYELGLNARKEE